MIFQLVQYIQSWISNSNGTRISSTGKESSSSGASTKTASNPHGNFRTEEQDRPPLKTATFSHSHSKQKSTGTSLNICRFFLSGKCKFGDRCRNLHTKPGALQPATKTEVSLHDEMMSRQQLKTKKEVDKVEPVPAGDDDDDSGEDVSVLREDQFVQKESVSKQSMKTATNVIHRILWDDQLPTEDFVVGYLDRFVGIIEKPFHAFSWEDLSTVSYNVLAIPKHRIQYFKYKDVIVWDKRTQVDEVFGSRGSTRTILDVMKEVSGKDTAERKVKLDNCESSDSDLDPEDVEEDTRCSKMGIYKAKADKNRPTHFIYIPVFNSKEIVSKAKELQDYVVECDPRFNDGRLPLDNLHVSVGYVRLENQKECQRATQVLNELQPFFVSLLPPSRVIHSEGVDTFRDRLIFAKVLNFPALVRFVQLLLKRFQAAGISTPGNHEPYVPHITLLRLRRPMMREMNETAIEKWLYKPFETATFGDQPIQELRIGEMADFYVRYRFSISNCVLNLSPLVYPLVTHAAQTLCRFGLITEDVLREVENVLSRYGSSGDDQLVLKTEKAVENLRKHMKRVLEGKNKSVSLAEVDAMSTSSVVILRGLPGSGKSWFAHHCQEMREKTDSITVCSADSYFEKQKSGEYQFDPSLLPEAHQQCLQVFLRALSERKEIIVIDNTNVHHWEYSIYQYLSQLFGVRHYVLEVPCYSEKMAEIYALRNQHGVPMATVLRMFSTWEKDATATELTPSVVNPYQPTSPWSYSIIDLCLNDARVMSIVKENGYRVSIIYTGVYLTHESMWSILSVVPPLHPTVYVDHVTLVFHPTISQAGRLALGREVEVSPIGWAANNEVQALAVRLPAGVESANAVPHITISTESGVSPKYSNDLLQSNPQLTSFPHIGTHLKGKIGVVIEISRSANVDKGLAGRRFHVFSHEEFQSLLPFIKDHSSPREFNTETSSFVSAPKPRPPLSSPSNIGILSGEQKITKIFVFDFDGTLFDTPNPADGRARYERLTGTKWPHDQGWLRWPESLLPPLVSYPGPALPHFHMCCGQSGTLTVLLTGRIPSTREAVLEILYQHSVFPDQHFFKDSPIQRESTPAYKVRVVEQLLHEFPDVSCVEVFDDLDEVLSAFRQFAKQRAGVHFEIFDSKKLDTCYTQPPMSTSVVESFLLQSGRLPLPSHKEAAKEGIHFLSSQWAHVVQFRGPPDHLVLPFGSYVLGRRGDVDLCFLAPPATSHFECVDLLASQLEASGVVHVHRGYSARCPCVKVLLQYSSSTSVKFDIVFFIIREQEFFNNSVKLSKPSLSSLKAQMVAGDSASKAAITGPVFLQHILSRIQDQISIPEFGMAVEIVTWSISSQRLKGNAFSCIRTYHIVQVLADLAHKMKTEEDNYSALPKTDQLFARFISKAVSVSSVKWQQLFGDFVPVMYVPKLQDAFRYLQNVLDHKFGGEICKDYLLTILQRPVFPSPGFKSVAIQFGSVNGKLDWELQTILEGRMPTYIYQMISKGLDIQPSGNDIACGCITFAAENRESTMNIVSTVLKPLWNEMESYRKKTQVSMRLVTDDPFPQELFSSGKLSQSSCLQDTEILQKVEEFASQRTSSDDESVSGPRELHLPASLNSYQRLLVHQRAEQLGLGHVSVGVGPDRHVVLRQWK